MYYIRPKRKSMYSYLIPFLIILIIFAVIFFGWRTLNNFFLEGDRSTYNEKVFLSVESGSAKAMTVGKNEWQNAPDKIYLYRGEKIKTSTDGRLTLTFFDNSIIRLDTDTEVTFSQLKKKNETNDIETEVTKGNVWSKVKTITNPGSVFKITTDQLVISTDGAEFAVDYPSTVYVMDGSVNVGIKDGKNIIKTYTIGVGQQLMINKTDIESIKNGDIVKVIYAISDTFKSTNWYQWNISQNSSITTESTSSDTGSDSLTSGTSTTTSTASDSTNGTSTTTSATSDSTTGTDTTVTGTSNEMTIVGKYAAYTSPALVTNKSAITINGVFDSKNIKAVYVNGEKATVKSLSGDSKYDKAWTASSISLKTEGKNTVKIEAEDIAGSKTSSSITVIYDKTPPTTPVITKPVVKDGEVLELTDVEQYINGTVDNDTYYVIVNDYQLQQYKAGTKTFSYRASTAIGNLKVGKNEYKIYAKDKAGNLSTPVTITLTLDQKVIDKTKGTSTTTSITSATTSSASTDDKTGVSTTTEFASSGEVKITAPNGGKSFTTSETEFEIKGTVPKDTAKVMVNDYTLSLFKSGDTTFSYKAYASMKSLTIGQKNTYTAKAYAKDGKLLGSASITIDVESGDSGAPKVTIPSSTGSYTTTLDTIVIGGTVGKWVTHIYVNSKRLESYIPGSEKWSTSATLTSGKNTFSIRAEKNGVSVGTDSIEVNYKP